MTTYQVERIADIRAEAAPLLLRHWNEIALDKESVPLDPDWDTYERIESAGHYLVMTAREDGQLIGYVCFVLSMNPRYKTLLFAEGELFWLAPEHRKGMAGVRLLREAEKVLAGRGVKRILHKVKLHFDVGVLFERLGYKPIERVYSKMVN